MCLGWLNSNKDLNLNLELLQKVGPSWLLDLPVQPVPITTKVVSLNPAHGEVYSNKIMW